MQLHIIETLSMYPAHTTQQHIQFIYVRKETERRVKSQKKSRDEITINVNVHAILILRTNSSTTKTYFHSQLFLIHFLTHKNKKSILVCIKQVIITEIESAM